MAVEEQPQDVPPSDENMQHEPPTAPAAMAVGTKKRPRLDLNVGPKERKRGKTMFGLLVGTLNKAKIEDKERNASEAAKKRQMIEQRLQSKLRKETDSVRRAEEAKKDKTTANRKEEDLQLKDSIYKLRRTRLPQFANFLCTSDSIPPDDASPPPPSSNPLTITTRTHPPPIFYLPRILTSAQESFLSRRKTEVKEAADKEWDAFREERSRGVAEIAQLRQKAAEEDARKQAEADAKKDVPSDDVAKEGEQHPEPLRDAAMDVDDGDRGSKEDVDPESERKVESMQADDEDAVEY